MLHSTLSLNAVCLPSLVARYRSTDLTAGRGFLFSSIPCRVVEGRICGALGLLPSAPRVAEVNPFSFSGACCNGRDEKSEVGGRRSEGVRAATDSDGQADRIGRTEYGAENRSGVPGEIGIIGRRDQSGHRSPTLGGSAAVRAGRQVGPRCVHCSATICSCPRIADQITFCSSAGTLTNQIPPGCGSSPSGIGRVRGVGLCTDANSHPSFSSTRSGQFAKANQAVIQAIGCLIREPLPREVNARCGSFETVGSNEPCGSRVIVAVLDKQRSAQRLIIVSHAWDAHGRRSTSFTLFGKGDGRRSRRPSPRVHVGGSIHGLCGTCPAAGLASALPPFCLPTERGSAVRFDGCGFRPGTNG